jgi:hypothetical protein
MVFNRRLENLLALSAQGFFLRTKDDTDGVLRVLRQRYTQLWALGGKELMWNLKEDACSISGGCICSGGSTVVQVLNYLSAVFDYIMVSAAGDVYDRTDSAGVMLAPSLV